MSNTLHTLDTALVGRGVNASYLLSLRYYNTQNPTHVNCQYPNMLDWKYCGGESFDGKISNKYYLLYHRCGLHIYIISLYFIFAQELYLTHVLSN